MLCLPRAFEAPLAKEETEAQSNQLAHSFPRDSRRRVARDHVVAAAAPGGWLKDVAFPVLLPPPLPLPPTPSGSSSGRPVSCQSRAPLPPSGERDGPESAQRVGRGAAANREAQGHQPCRARLRLVVHRNTLVWGRGHSWPTLPWCPRDPSWSRR